jgi:hypothetical protein
LSVEPTSTKPVPSIRGEHVYLRPAERADIDLFVRWFSDAETTRYLAVRAPFSKAMEEKWFEEMLGATARRPTTCDLPARRTTDRSGPRASIT